VGSKHIPVAPVSTIAVGSGVRRGSGVMCGLGEDIDAGIVSGGLQRHAVGVKYFPNWY